MFQKLKSKFVRVISLFIFFFLLSATAFCQTPWAWANGIHSNAAEWINDIAVDTSTGEVVTVGIFNSDLSAFYGSNFSGANGGAFVAKHDADGNVLWAFRIGNNQDDAANAVVIDPTGNIYVTGYFQNIADLKGTLSSPSTTFSAVGGKDIWLAKYNPAGQLIWARHAEGLSDDEGKGICINSGAVFVCGYYTNTASFGSLSAFSPSATQNAFVAAYDLNGNEQWVADAGAATDAYGHDIAADENFIYLAGDYRGASLSVNNSSGIASASLTNSTPTKFDAFAASWSVAGAFNWIGAIEGSGNDFAHAICTGATDVFITGSAESSVNFPGYASNPILTTGGSLDFFVARLDNTTGATVWAKIENGNGGDDEGKSIAAQKNNGEIYVAGFYKNSLSFSGGGSLPNAGGNEDVFVAAYDTSGNFIWSQSAGASGKDIAYAVAPNYTGGVFVAGEYADNAAFGSTTLTNNGSSNIFLAKLGCEILTNNLIAADQIICEGTSPAQLTGSLPAGGNTPYTYIWEESTNNVIWASASGINNLQNYAPPVLSTSFYYRRKVYSASGCADTSWSAPVFINVNPLPSASNAGPDQQICNTNFSLNALAPSSGTGDWNILTSGVSLTSTNIPSPSSTSFVYGANELVWVVSSGVCPDSKDTVIITIDSLPSAAVAGPDQSICSTTFTLSANTPSSGSGVWSVYAGSVSFSNTSLPATSISSVATGNNFLVWTITNGVCPPASDTINITGLPLPSPSIAGNDSSVCNSNFNLNANIPNIGTGSWNILSAGTTISSATIHNPSSLTFVTGANIFEWVISNGICPDTRDTVIITVDLPPTPAVAGADQVFCGDTTNLNANTPVTGAGLWTVFSGAASFTDNSSALTHVTSISPGANVLVWQITNGACAASADTINLFSFSLPSVSNAGPDQVICSPSTFFAANNPTSGNGTWNIVSSSATVSNANVNSSAVNFLSAGANVFSWEISNGTCPVSKDTVIIFVDQNPDIAVAGADVSVCGDSVVLNANSPLIGTGIWSVLTGAGSFSNSGAPASQVNTMSNGQNTFIWTVSNGVCPVNRDTVVITSFTNPSLAFAGNDTTVCSASTLLGANIPLSGNGNWTAISTGLTISAPANPASSVSALATGQNFLEWVISNGPCPVSRDTVIISVDALPDTSNAGTDIQVCGDSVLLNANNPTVGNGSWTFASGGGTLSDAFIGNAALSAANYGSNELVWTIANGVCPASTDTVIINCYQAPSVAAAGNDTSICISSGNLTLNANNPAIGTGQWTIITSGATLSSLAAPNATAGNFAAGVNEFEWTISNGVCPPEKDTLIIQADMLPSSAFAGADDTICGDSTLLGANAALSGTGTWSVFSGSGTFTNLLLASSAVTGLTPGSNVLIWTISNGVCVPSADTVNIFADAIPTSANAGSDITLCNSSFVLNGNTPLVGTGQWNVLSVGASVSSPNTPSSGVNSLINGINIFEWVITNGICPPSRDTMVIAIDSFPSNAVCGPDQIICGFNTTLSANTPNTGTGTWSVFSGAGTFANPTLPGTTISALGTGINTFIWTTANGQCPSSHDTVVITAYAPPDVAVAGNNFSVCADTCSINGNTPVNGTGTWSVYSGSSLLADSASALCSVNSLSAGTNVFIWTITNGVCPANSDSVIVSRDLPPTSANAGPDISTELNSIEVNGNVPVIGSGNWMFISGNGYFSSPTSPQSYVNGLSEGTAMLAWVISNGACPSSADTLVLTIEGLFIPQVITPNGDGKNETFEIRAYDGMDGMELEISNRWGQTVFKRSNYKNDFRGITDSGDDLPDDTYFYILKTPSEKYYKGYLEVKRK